MRYTNYFSSLVKEQGPPHLNSDQFKRMMNIVFLEGMIAGMEKIKVKEKSQTFKYDMLIFKQNQVLTQLTGNLHPSGLIREMYQMSNC
jgi:hypothetical protein